MCVLRCDFMIDQPSNSVKLVEYNTIASSFGVLSQKVKFVQEYLRHKYEGQIEYNYKPLKPLDFDADLARTVEFGNTAQNSFTEKMVANFKTAMEHYKRTLKEKFNIESQDPWVLFVVEDKERNVVDQKIIETELQKHTGIKSMRMTFAEIYEAMKMDENHVLTIRNKEIGFVYYRAGYQVE